VRHIQLDQYVNHSAKILQLIEKQHNTNASLQRLKPVKNFTMTENQPAPPMYDWL
jgi:hypothetical protein